ncbi:MAG TPA: hypothetical protein VHO94_02030 [Oscillospiraceae bacterium]|nr:hypothetical protein [Oscillospiraceae bacterium]
MRKVLAIACGILLLVALSACSAKSVEPTNIVFAFTCSAKVTTKNGDVSCTITRAAPQSESITVQSPKELNGMTYTWEDNFSISYEGLQTKSTDCTLPPSSFAAQIVGVLDAASKQDALTDVGDSVFTGKFDNDTYTLTVDSKTGHIQQIEIPRYGISAKLDHYKNISE